MPLIEQVKGLIDDYRIRVLGCTALALFLLIAIVNWWPLPGEPELDLFPYYAGAQELIALEEIQPTRQSQKPPPPPPPMIPLIVPDDLIIEDEVEIEDSFLVLEEYGEDMEMAEALSSGNTNAGRAPQIGPRPLRFVEPEYTREARRKNVKAEVVVEVFVDEKGRVQEARVVERFLYSKGNKNKQTVPSLSYGLEESALSAAQKWTFRPAKQNGYPVRSYTTLTFSFGV